MLRWQTAGESHGEALVAMIEGVRPGLRSRATTFVGPSPADGWGMAAARA